MSGAFIGVRDGVSWPDARIEFAVHSQAVGPTSAHDRFAWSTDEGNAQLGRYPGGSGHVNRDRHDW